MYVIQHIITISTLYSFAIYVVMLVQLTKNVDLVLKTFHLLMSDNISISVNIHNVLKKD